MFRRIIRNGWRSLIIRGGTFRARRLHELILGIGTATGGNLLVSTGSKSDQEREQCPVWFERSDQQDLGVGEEDWLDF